MAQSHAKKVYNVSINGNDKNTWSIAKRLKTIQKAANIMNAGDICYIKQGVHSENIKLPNDGMAESQINFSNFRKDTVVVMATKAVIQREHYKGNIYKAYFPDIVLQVFVIIRNHPLVP